MCEKDTNLINSNMDLVREARREILEWTKYHIPVNEGLKYSVDIGEFKELFVRRSDIINWEPVSWL